MKTPCFGLYSIEALRSIYLFIDSGKTLMSLRGQLDRLKLPWVKIQSEQSSDWKKMQLQLSSAQYRPSDSGPITLKDKPRAPNIYITQWQS